MRRQQVQAEWSRTRKALVDEETADRLVREAQRFIDRMAVYMMSKGIQLESTDDS
jgi:hypothetical protein